MLREDFFVIFKVNAFKADGVSRHLNGISHGLALGVDVHVRNIHQKVTLLCFYDKSRISALLYPRFNDITHILYTLVNHRYDFVTKV